MWLNQNENDEYNESEDDESDNEINFNDGTEGMTASSLALSTTNRTPSNVITSSCHDNVNPEVDHGDNSPARQRKSAPDSWSTIERTKNYNFLVSDEEGMFRSFAKFFAMIKCFKDKKRVSD